MTNLADCHVHLDQFEDFDVIERDLAEAGIGLALSAGMDLGSSRRALELASQSSRVQGAIGLHPWNVGRDWPSQREEFAALAGRPECRAISEVGLDDTFVDVPSGLQRDVLMWFVELAQRESLPMVLHVQVPFPEFLELWSSIEGEPPRAAIHGFVGTLAEAEMLLEKGLWLSLGTTSTGFFGGPAVDDEVIRAVPEDRILIDSDSCVPADLGRSVGALTPASREMLEGLDPVMPSAAREVVEVVARVRGTSFENVCSSSSRNLERFLKSSTLEESKLGGPLWQLN